MTFNREYREHILRLHHEACTADDRVAEARKAGNSVAAEHWLCRLARAVYERNALLEAK